MIKRNKFISMLLAMTLMLTLIPATASPALASSGGLISSVEVTQIAGKGIDLESGKYYFMNSFVAEKPTSIQVVLTQPTNITSATLDIYYENEKLTTVTYSERGSRQLLVFTPGKDAVNAWKAGRYKFVANVNGASKTTEAIFNLSRSFSILVISASVKSGNNVYAAPDIDANTIALRTQALPISESKMNAKYRNAKISFGTGKAGYDIGVGTGSMDLLMDIENYRTKSAMNYDVVVAVVDAPLGEPDSETENTTTGYTNSMNAVVLSIHANPSPEKLETTLLHELGHIFGNGDEYVGGSFKLNVNGAPYGVSGSEGGKEVKGERDFLKHAKDNDYSGIIIEEVQNPYNPKAGVPMLNRSSFMGSSYRHWPTSMVWEAAYKHLVPNYLNVLPRVYTDGSIVAERTATDEITEAERSALIAEYRAELNDIRVGKGFPPFKDDEILAAGQKHLRTLTKEILAQRGFETPYSLTPFYNAVSAELNSHISKRYFTGMLREYDGAIEHGLFYRQSPCGSAFVENDYIILDFAKIEGVIYYLSTGYGGVSPIEEGVEIFVPQPGLQPLPEYNPVTDETIVPGSFTGNSYTPATSGTSGGGSDVGGGNNVGGGTSPSQTASPAQSETSDTSEYAKLSEQEQLKILSYDGFDVGSPYADYDEDFVYGFLAWYTNMHYDLGLSAGQAKNAIFDIIENAADESFGMAEYAELSRFQCLAEYYQLYPPREMRENDLVRSRLDLKFPVFGENPQPAKGESIDEYLATADVYPDYNDLTERQKLEMLAYHTVGDSWIANHDDPIDYIFGYYVEYLNDQYGLRTSVLELHDKFEGYLVSEYLNRIFAAYQLFPSQVLRKEYPDVFDREYPFYGKHPARAKDDTDSIEFYLGKSTDADIKDPDGKW